MSSLNSFSRQLFWNVSVVAFLSQKFTEEWLKPMSAGTWWAILRWQMCDRCMLTFYHQIYSLDRRIITHITWVWHLCPGKQETRGAKSSSLSFHNGCLQFPWIFMTNKTIKKTGYYNYLISLWFYLNFNVFITPLYLLHFRRRLFVVC